MKECKKCQTVKPLEDFALQTRLSDGRQTYCKECGRAYGKLNYQLNKPRYFAQAKNRDRRMRSELDDLKSGPCADCGVCYPPVVMDFDHLGDKEFDISVMRKRRMAMARILVEIAKCELVCSNCHRMRTHNRSQLTTS